MSLQTGQRRALRNSTTIMCSARLRVLMRLEEFNGSFLVPFSSLGSLSWQHSLRGYKVQEKWSTLLLPSPTSFSSFFSSVALRSMEHSTVSNSEISIIEQFQ